MLSLNKVRALEKAVRASETVAIVSFVPDPGDVQPADQQTNGSVATSATRLGRHSLAGQHNEVLHVRGVFRVVLRLQNAFRSFGSLNENVLVGSRRPDSPYRRLKVLLAAEPARPLCLLAVGTKRSSHILDANLSGPLADGDGERIQELVKQFEKPRRAFTVEYSESLLDSPNPWLVWLGLAKLQKHDAVTARHFRKVIEDRPTAETSQLFEAMLDLAFGNGPCHADFMPELEALLGLPEKQLVILHELKPYIEINPDDAANTMDLPRFRNWLLAYKGRIAGQDGVADVREVIDQLLAWYASRGARSES